MKARYNEQGFAVLFVLLITVVLFILFSAVLRGVAVWRLRQEKTAEENQKSAAELLVYPDPEPRMPESEFSGN